MSDLKLGHIITTPQNRDAIHIAVAPVTAAHAMNPGDHIGLIDNDCASAKASALIGIVDPFLREVVVTGEQFWLFLYPQTVTSLRHEWEHPAFSAPAKPTTDKAASEKWLRELCEEIGYEFESLLDDARDGSGDYIMFHGIDTPEELRDESRRERAIHHLNVVLGTNLSPQTRFCCAC